MGVVTRAGAVLRAFGTCAECGERFEMLNGQAYNVGTPAEQRYCGALCRRANERKRRFAAVGTCSACGPSADVRLFTGGAMLCSRCRYLVRWSCWRKLRSETAADSLVGRGTDVELYPYLCPLCDGWHVSSHGLGDTDYAERVERIAGHFREIGIDLGALRAGRRVR